MLLNVDSYKVSMWKQYPPSTEKVYSYIESRSGDETVFFGLQALIKEYLQTPIQPKEVFEAEEFWKAHGEPFNTEGWFNLVQRYNGYLPIEIRAVREGSVIPSKNVLLTVENTDPEFFWITTWLETALLRAIWYPSTVATNSRRIKQLIKKYLQDTDSYNAEGIEFMLHDFGSRGVSSTESAMLGGMGHLVNFLGTDTAIANVGAKKYYNESMAGFSIPAAEHSTITAWGRDRETDAYKNMLVQFASPGALVAVVSDSYDIYNAVDFIWGQQLKQHVVDSGATVVIRPDSGYPPEVVLKVLRSLSDRFGYTLNTKGYKVLNNVRVIQGDGISYGMIYEILEAAKTNGFAASNLAFGMGGELLQHVSRDDYNFAQKASEVTINGKSVPISKSPVTDPTKRSKEGRLSLIKEQGIGSSSYRTIKSDNLKNNQEDLLVTVFKDGELILDQDFSEIRNRAQV